MGGQHLPWMLSSALEHLLPRFSPQKRTSEILIVDDGSSDSTAAAALEFSAERHGSENLVRARLKSRRPSKPGPTDDLVMAQSPA